MKKLIAVMAALMVAAVLFNINVSAMSESSYSRQYVELLSDYKNGYISYDELNSSLNSLNSDYASENTKKVTQAITGNMEDIIAEYGEDFLNNLIGDSFNDYATTESVSTTDMKGYGALLYIPTDGVNYTDYIYCEYIVVSTTGSPPTVYAEPFGEELSETYYPNGNFRLSQAITWAPSTELSKCKVYGDVRYSDGTQAPTNDDFVDQPTHDFSSLSDTELDKLLNELNEMLERQNPDLSTMEGLLESIYYRLGELDKDNDNALLSEINAAIISLAKDGQSQNLELISKLDELKEALEGGEKSDLTEITEELKEISTKLGHLCNMEVAENALELTEDEQKLFDEWANLIPVLVDKVGLAVVTQTMHDIETVIFTTSAPSDLTFTLFDDTYVLLSTETFSDENVMLSINNIKTFISVILVYVWCVRMRRLLI